MKTANIAHSPKRLQMSHSRRVGDGICSQGDVGGFGERLEVWSMRLAQGLKPMRGKSTSGKQGLYAEGPALESCSNGSSSSRSSPRWTEMPLVGSTSFDRSWSRSSPWCPAAAEWGDGEEGASCFRAILPVRGVFGSSLGLQG